MSSSDFNEIENTPPEILEAADNAASEILPEKSKARYNKMYQKFMDWRTDKKINSFSENVLLAYFKDISDQFKPSSLWCIYSMLRSVLILKNDVNIAIYPKLKAYLKRQSDGFRGKKSKAFTSKEINTFIKNAPDIDYLLMKVILICGISGACRRQELKNIKMEDIEDSGKSIIINIPDTKTKIYRSFVVSGSFYDICKKYLQIRQKIQDASIRQFLLKYQKGKCVRQVVGLNKIGGTPKEIAKYLNLENPSAYTGHCYRRSSATLLVDAGGDLITLKRHGGWKSSTVAESYVDDSLLNKTTTANKILNIVNDEEPLYEESYTDQPSTSYSASSTGPTSNMILQKSGAPIILKNCENFTININTNS